jgi:uncharacterized protein YbjT (DUF2867 family)
MFVFNSGISSKRVVTMSASDNKKKVVITGAGGRTGQLVMKKLLQEQDVYYPVGVVRSDSSAEKLKALGASEDQIVVGDILGENGNAMLDSAMEKGEKLVICTSAVPQIIKLSLIPVILAKIFRKEGVRPKFTFKEDQTPEQVDWIGQKMQIDAARKAGIEKVVLVGSMGGTQSDNFLNTIGDGNILVWKRRAEKYLIDSGLNYTIIHPGGLKDDEGGKREILLNVDDAFLNDKSGPRSIPRADVAELCVQSLSMADRRSIDCVARDPQDGEPTRDFAALFANMSRNCDYSDMKNDPFVGASFASKA